ncbi:hypothetical protein DFP73DRAFT_601373 [Morchella snyderi]|nr:hypothetical protein DFP73DRAFT_601373 [Morchella snyderi]
MQYIDAAGGVKLGSILTLLEASNSQYIGDYTDSATGKYPSIWTPLLTPLQPSNSQYTNAAAGTKSRPPGSECCSYQSPNTAPFGHPQAGKTAPFEHSKAANTAPYGHPKAANRHLPILEYCTIWTPPGSEYYSYQSRILHQMDTYQAGRSADRQPQRAGGRVGSSAASSAAQRRAERAGSSAGRRAVLRARESGERWGASGVQPLTWQKLPRCVPGVRFAVKRRRNWVKGRTRLLTKRRLHDEIGRDVSIFLSRRCLFAPERMDSGKKTTCAPGTPGAPAAPPDAVEAPPGVVVAP